ncbi:MGMT family protein [Sphaerulina musiva SO2202]|uniref:MGMT family protein n=1 Tax=Sphaerulina musiva (strain SO2202) TaxID=692275 RepID=M3D2P3_SPHMS|nr:MGMT family protein [Sphaerulina musiva SO2202]EMF11412.1 MGMT family protein [Sphaerulina musiva SO2202]
MPRSEEAASWYTMVYRAVQQIPPGSVTSYGHIATLLGYPQVGMCLKYLPSATDQPDARYNCDTVPWQRVINSKGSISQRGTNGAADQETALLAEGVEVGRGSLGERTVDFSSYGWFPEILPSDADDEQQQQQESMNA